MARLPDDLPAHKALNCQINLSQADHEVASGIAVLVVLVTDGKGKGKGRYRSSWEPHLRATGRHLPYGITQCYLPPDTSERAPPYLSHTGW